MLNRPQQFIVKTTITILIIIGCIWLFHNNVRKAHSAELNCTMTFGSTGGYLLGQAGAKVSKGVMADPALDCSNGGWGGSLEGYFATDRGPWRYEVDALVRYTETIGQLNWGARAGVYQVSPGTGDITIFNARWWVNYTIPLSTQLSLRFGGILDELRNTRLDKDTVGWSTNATLRWQMTDRFAFLLSVERWDWIAKGFFENGKSNHKVIPGIQVALDKTWLLNTDWTFMRGNQFDHTMSRHWENAWHVGLTAKLPPL